MKIKMSTKVFVVIAEFLFLLGIGVLFVVLFILPSTTDQHNQLAASVDIMQGEVTLFPADGRSAHRLAVEEKLNPGDILENGSSGVSTVVFSNSETMLEMAPDSDIVLHEIGERAGQQYAEFELIRGEVKVSTALKVIGVRTQSGIVAAGGNDSVLVVSLEPETGTATAFCHAGSCAFQNEQDTFVLEIGQLVSLEIEDIPVLASDEKTIASEDIRSPMVAEAESSPEPTAVSPAELTPAVAVESSNSGVSNLLNVLKADQPADRGLTIQSEQDQSSGLPTATQQKVEEPQAASTAVAESSFPASREIDAKTTISLATDILSGSWYLLSFSYNGSLNDVITGSNVHITYTPGAGEISGFSGCNNYTGTIDDSSGEINIQNIFSTKLKCYKPVQEQERIFFGLLRKVVNGEVVDGSTLKLTTKAGDTLLFSSTNPAGEGSNTRPALGPTSTPVPSPTPIPPTPTSPPVSPDAFYVSISGNDSNPGTYQQPWRTIEKASNTLAAGQTAIVLAGSYPERIFLGDSGITLQAEGEVLMKGFTIDGDNNEIIGFTISDATQNAGIYVRGDNNQIVNNEIYHMKQDGIWFFGSNNVYRGNYIHDILDPSISSDYHADCFQTWAGYGPVINTLFEGNVCDHNRNSGSNQIFMVEAQSAVITNLVVKNNTFYMYDSGYSPLNINRKDGQYAISGVKILNNRFENFSGAGSFAIWFCDVTGGEISGNVVIGYDTVWQNDGSTNIVVNNNVMQ